ncbi:MAG TPA: MATE family efflux transporter [Candidatus Acidoferrales bacterium]|nr:MATE family efflux transporter [Candidatus Acidoferrales bacterium]
MNTAAMLVDHRNVGAAFRRLSIPVAVAMLGDQLLGIADTIAIGSLGVVALAGATAANTMFLALNMANAGFLSGTSIVAAQRVGAQDMDGFARTVRSGALAPLVAGVLFFIGAWFWGGIAIHATVGDLASGSASAAYLTVRCLSILPIIVSGSLIVGLGQAGNQKLGIWVLIAINVVHIPLLLMLALGWWTHHPMGILGAGISSFLSETVGMAFAIFYVARRPAYRIFSKLTISLKTAWQTTLLGLPEVVFLFTVMLPDIFIVAMLAPFGATAVAAFRALNVVSDLTFVIPSPLQSATQTVVGQRIGAGDIAGAQAFFARAQRVTLLITAIAGVVAAALAWPLAFAFTLNAAVASIAALPLAVHMITLPIKGWSMVSLAPIRASGDTRFSMLVGILCSALVIPLTWFGIERLNLALYAVPIAWITAWLARALITELKLRNGAWTRTAPITT